MRKGPHSMTQSRPFDPAESVFAAYNHTELIQACAAAGILVRPNESKEGMIAYLEGASEPPDMEEDDNAINNWRNAFHGFFREHWKGIETQITCPARHMMDKVNPQPRPCYGCSDMQVMACVAILDKNEEKVRKHKVARRPRKPCQ